MLDFKTMETLKSNNEISSKHFFVKEHNHKYSLSELIQILKKLKI